MRARVYRKKMLRKMLPHRKTIQKSDSNAILFSHVPDVHPVGARFAIVPVRSPGMQAIASVSQSCGFACRREHVAVDAKVLTESHRGVLHRGLDEKWPRTTALYEPGPRIRFFRAIARMRSRSALRSDPIMSPAPFAPSGRPRSRFHSSAQKRRRAVRRDSKHGRFLSVVPQRSFIPYICAEWGGCRRPTLSLSRGNRSTPVRKTQPRRFDSSLPRPPRKQTAPSTRAVFRPRASKRWRRRHGRRDERIARERGTFWT